MSKKKIVDKEVKKVERKEKKINRREKGNPVFEINRVPDPANYQQAIYDGIDMIKLGWPRKVITEKLFEKYNHRDLAISSVAEAIKLYSGEYCKEDDYTLSLHVQRYNQEIVALKERFSKEYLSRFPKDIHVNIQQNAIMNILDIMVRKERLLQLHSKKVTIRLSQTNNSFLTRNFDFVEYDFDLSKLNKEEKIELLQLVQKTKLNDEEEYFYNIKKQEEVVEQHTNIEDAEFEEVLNVDKIVETNKEDNQEYKSKNLQEVEDLIKKTFAKIAEKELKK